MPSISYRRLHKRDHMLRVLSAAGQFVHVPVEIIADRLDELYDPNVRFARLNGRFSNNGEDWAVPWTLLKAADYLTCKVYDAETINYMGRAEGVTCCLCLTIDKDVPTVTHFLPSDFVQYVCPTFLRHRSMEVNPWSGRPTYQCGQPICAACRKGLSSRIWKDFKHSPPRDRNYWNLLLNMLWQYPGFQKRVVQNAKNAERLRFDPRRIQWPEPVRMPRPADGSRARDDYGRYLPSNRVEAA